MDGLFSNLNFWSVVGTFFAALTALIIAVWGDYLKSIFFKPKLEILYTHKWPDAIKIPYSKKEFVISDKDRDENNLDQCYFFRFRIKNIGNTPAKNIEVIVQKIEKKLKNGSYKECKDFIPLNLTWSFGKGEKIKDILNPGMENYCDLGFILHPQRKQIIELLKNDSLRIPVNKYNILFIMPFVIRENIVQNYILPPGDYKIQLVCVASNFQKETISLELKFDEKWKDNYEEMLSEISIKKIN